MWYFAWILGVLLACSFGIINALWLEHSEMMDKDSEQQPSCYFNEANKQPDRQAVYYGFGTVSCRFIDVGAYSICQFDRWVQSIEGDIVNLVNVQQYGCRYWVSPISKRF